MEKLIPGAITLRARQKPQNRYQKKFGLISTLVILSPMRSAKIAHMHTIMDT